AAGPGSAAIRCVHGVRLGLGTPLGASRGGCRSCGDGFDILGERMSRVVEDAVKYLILIYSNPQSRAIWEGYSDARRAEGWRGYAALTEDLAASGELVVTEA